jgi:hypothetical protein
MPEQAYDPNFEMQTEFYEENASFRVPLAVVASAKPGEAKGTIDVLFQACTDRVCLPPTTAHVSLTVTIAGGTAKRVRTRKASHHRRARDRERSQMDSHRLRSTWIDE